MDIDQLFDEDDFKTIDQLLQLGIIALQQKIKTEQEIKIEEYEKIGTEFTKRMGEIFGVSTDHVTPKELIRVAKEHKEQRYKQDTEKMEKYQMLVGKIAALKKWLRESNLLKKE